MSDIGDDDYEAFDEFGEFDPDPDDDDNEDDDDDQDQEKEDNAENLEGLGEFDDPGYSADITIIDFQSDLDTIKELSENKNTKTHQVLSKYEKANVIGYRATQISEGAPSFLKDSVLAGLRDPILIAEKELSENKLPILIKRRLPGKTADAPRFEIFRVSM